MKASTIMFMNMVILAAPHLSSSEIAWFEVIAFVLAIAALFREEL